NRRRVPIVPAKPPVARGRVIDPKAVAVEVEPGRGRICLNRRRAREYGLFHRERACPPGAGRPKTAPVHRFISARYTSGIKFCSWIGGRTYFDLLIGGSGSGLGVRSR